MVKTRRGIISREKLPYWEDVVPKSIHCILSIYLFYCIFTMKTRGANMLQDLQISSKKGYRIHDVASSPISLSPLMILNITLFMPPLTLFNWDGRACQVSPGFCWIYFPSSRRLVLPRSHLVSNMCTQFVFDECKGEERICQYPPGILNLKIQHQLHRSIDWETRQVSLSGMTLT